MSYTAHKFTKDEPAPLNDLLIIDDDADILGIVQSALADLRLSMVSAKSLAEARDFLWRRSFRVILSDQHLGDGNGIDFLAEIGDSCPETIPILMSGAVDVNTAIAAINRGRVFKVVTKPLDLFTLVQCVRRAVQQHREDEEKRRWSQDLVELTDHLRRESLVMNESLLDATRRLEFDEQEMKRQQQRISDIYAELQESYLRTVMSLMAAINAKDRYTKGHSDRVFYYCSLMADTLTLSESSHQSLRFASILHDVGKIGIPDAILLKVSSLTDEERLLMQSHPLMSETILEPLPFLSQVRTIIRQHHEKFDGTGYPDGLKNHQILLEARILAVADAYDAMRSDRPYRSALSVQTAREQLRRGSGTQFCPLCVESLLQAIDLHGEQAQLAPHTDNGINLDDPPFNRAHHRITSRTREAKSPLSLN